MDNQWSAMDIEVVLHYYYSPEPHPRYRVALQQSVQRMVAAGVLDLKSDIGDYPSDGKAAGDFKITDRGRKFMEMICDTPLPVKNDEWVDPRKGGK